MKAIVILLNINKLVTEMPFADRSDRKRSTDSFMEGWNSDPGVHSYSVIEVFWKGDYRNESREL